MKEREEGTYIVGHEVSEVRLCETLSKEITHMTKTEEDEVAYVGGEEDVVWGLLNSVLLDRFTIIMLGDATIGLVCTVTKFRVNRGEDLLRGWGSTGVGERVGLTILKKDGVLGGSCYGGGK